MESTPAKPLPRIVAGICEFCGVKAPFCQHSAAFKAAGKLDRGEAAKEEAKIYQNFSGLPRVINKICEHCGVDALDEKRCLHYASRRKLAMGSKEPGKIIEKVGNATIETIPAPEPAKVEASGDSDMDALMDADEAEPQA